MAKNGWRDTKLLALRMEEGGTRQENGGNLQNLVVNEMDSPLEPPKGTQPC